MFHSKTVAASESPCLWYNSIPPQQNHIVTDYWCKKKQSEDEPARLSSHKEAPDIPSSNNIDKIINNFFKKQTNKQTATGKLGNC